MRAIVLAGGKGVRLRPYTTLIPKPLVPLGGKISVLEIVLTQLSKAGFTRVTLAVNHLSHLIMSYFGDGSRWGIEIDYSLEDYPLSTIGPLTLIDDLPENFLVMNGDILCDLNYKDFYDLHTQQSADVTVSTYRREVSIDFGVIEVDANNCLCDFKEKPKYYFDVSMGIYCISKTAIDRLVKGQIYGFDNLMLDGLRNKNKINIYPFDGFWLDIGRPEDYENADRNFDSIMLKLGI